MLLALPPTLVAILTGVGALVVILLLYLALREMPWWAIVAILVIIGFALWGEQVVML